MKPLCEPFEFVTHTVLGKKHVQTRQYFEIEASDHKISNWLGYGQPDKTVYAHELGKKLCHYKDDTGWSCWSFAADNTTDL